jgi:hypothetical protein
MMLILLINKLPFHENLWRVEGELYAFLTSALDGAE